MAVVVLLLIAGILIALSKLSPKNGVTSAEKHNSKAEKILSRNSNYIKSQLKNVSDGKLLIGQRPYGLDNLVRDLLNELCTMESQARLKPGHSYLSRWQRTAPPEWQHVAKNLLEQISKAEKYRTDREKECIAARKKIQDVRATRIAPERLMSFGDKYRSGKMELMVEDISAILKPNYQTWKQSEDWLISGTNPNATLEPIADPKLPLEIETNREIESFNSLLNEDNIQYQKVAEYFRHLRHGYQEGKEEFVVKRINFLIDRITLPRSCPHDWETSYDANEKIAVVEIFLPDVLHTQIQKYVEQKKGAVKKPLNQKQKKEYLPQFHPAIAVRVATEIPRSDQDSVIKLLVLNGIVEFISPSTGKLTQINTLSLAVNREQIDGLNLEKIDPIAAFISLKGRSAGRLVDFVPVTPILNLNRDDKRIIDTKSVINGLSEQTNLAAMEWQDFENLIAELFQRVFDKDGAEVKVTQASRDRGVDAIVFDPDPIKGGKFVIQAKRYTNTVDVSAVRDLCAVVKKEGASRGILVTTSTFGSDAYAFANNEPITLLNGNELLGLLEKYGYKFRINLDEARRLQSTR